MAEEITTIFFVRHGEYENPNDVNPFRTPGFPLSSLGRMQAKEAADFLKGEQISFLYTSPILRTKQTAEILAEGLGLKPVVKEEFIEVETPYKGLPNSEVDKAGFFYDTPYHVENGGESTGQIAARMKKGVFDAIEIHTATQIVIVSHADPIMFFISEEKGIHSSAKIWSDKDYIPMGGIIRAEFSGTFLKSAIPANYD